MIKSLIIKSSYSKLQNGKLKSNFGDLIRSTVLLNCMDDDFLWISDSRGINLLKWFVDPKKIFQYGMDINDYNLSPELKIYNIDNYIVDRKFFKQIKGEWRGYAWDREENIFAENKSIAFTEPYKNSVKGPSWQQALVEGMGFTWKKQDYAYPIVENKPSTVIGLNWHVHPEWKSKQWAMEHWKELENILQKTHPVSWQKGLNDFDEYMDWLASCHVIVTCDTLGLHLASALRKKVVAIVGATESRECSYNRVAFIKPDFRDCMPCNLPICEMEKNCLDEIDAKKVSEIVLSMFSQKN